MNTTSNEKIIYLTNFIFESSINFLKYIIFQKTSKGMHNNLFSNLLVI